MGPEIFRDGTDLQAAGDGPQRPRLSHRAQRRLGKTRQEGGHPASSLSACFFHMIPSGLSVPAAPIRRDRPAPAGPQRPAPPCAASRQEMQTGHGRRSAFPPASRHMPQRPDLPFLCKMPIKQKFIPALDTSKPCNFAEKKGRLIAALLSLFFSAPRQRCLRQSTNAFSRSGRSSVQNSVTATATTTTATAAMMIQVLLLMRFLAYHWSCDQVSVL